EQGEHLTRCENQLSLLNLEQVSLIFLRALRMSSYDPHLAAPLLSSVSSNLLDESSTALPE
ncbi:MAG: hypothetical protein ACYSTI_13150, partial [Planctomycetota bacterium]